MPTLLQPCSAAGGLPIPSAGKLDEGAHRDPGWAFRLPWLRIVEPRRRGDVEMDPGRWFGKLPQKPGGCDRATIAPTDIGKIGESRFQVILVLFVHRQFPGLLACLPGGSQELP